MGNDKETTMNTYRTIAATAMTVLCTAAAAQDNAAVQADTTAAMENKTQHLHGITVTGSNGTRRMMGAVNGVSIGQKEMFRAACCNLGESFVTNPSVDVSYSDAATGAKQIKLLGLSGTYVQMLTENMPNFRGVAMPYALGYVPGTWMKSIQVSKGSSSVKNGYESITGQINIEYLKPEDPQTINVNLFGDTKTRFEANIDGNIKVNDRLSTVLMGHFENTFEEHDENNDGFYDKPKARQYNLMNRWLWKNEHYIFHGGASMLHEKRQGGQMDMGGNTSETVHGRYKIDIETDRYEAYMKHAFVFDHEHGSNIALFTSASMQELSATFGHKDYYVNEKNLYASLVFETHFNEQHSLSAGLSLNHDYLGQSLGYNSTASYLTSLPDIGNEKETVPGAYAQYTLDIGHKLTAMAGLRIDHSSLYGTFWTPRFHLKYAPSSVLSLRLSAGKGYRTVHALAENNFLLASGRQLNIGNLSQEEAWNYGASAALLIPIGEKTLKINAEYYYTRFSNQAVTDYDSDPMAITIANLDGKSYSHTAQIDATYPLFSGFTLTAAYRINDVKCSYGGRLMEKPLTSKYKGLLTASYKTPLEKWQIDVTLQLNGGGRMPTPYSTANGTPIIATGSPSTATGTAATAAGTPSWDSRFKAYGQLSAQITREFRHFSVYVGGENLTGFTQKNPIIGADNPWSNTFEPTLVWGPVHGRVLYAGTRIRL